MAQNESWSKCSGLWRCAAGFSGFVAIVMGAIGAHALSDAHAASLIEKASFYQLVHSAMIFLMLAPNRMMATGRWLLAIGTLLFCGTLYLKALLGWEEITPLAPIGGCSFMLGWLALALGGIKKS